MVGAQGALGRVVALRGVVVHAVGDVERPTAQRAARKGDRAHVVVLASWAVWRPQARTRTSDTRSRAERPAARRPGIDEGPVSGEAGPSVRLSEE